MEKRLRKIMDLLPIIALLLITVVILVVSFDAVIQAYYDLQCTDKKVIQSLESINLFFNKITNSEPNNERLDSLSQMYMACLQEKSSGDVNVNSLSFLFQLFSVGLLTAGAFILNTSARNLRKTKQELKSLKENNNQIAQLNTIMSSALDAVQIVYLLRILENSVNIPTNETLEIKCLSRLLDLVKLNLKEKLQEIKQKKWEIPKSYLDQLNDHIQFCITELNNYKNQEKIKQIKEYLQECEQLVE